MPWKETSSMHQRSLFIADYTRKLFPLAELCRRFGISRKTAYKWIDRYEAYGPPALVDRSHRPLRCPNATPPDIVELLLEARRRRPRLGPKKLLTMLANRHPDLKWPAISTVCDILKRNGLVTSPRRRRPLGHPGKPTISMTEPNETWAADFKGHFKTGDAVYCYPLTVTDGFSRYILACTALLTTSHQCSQPVFQKLFYEFGLPKIIRTDNGVPFATPALGRLSRLSVWWIRLGIYPELIEPSHPEQNARHERMHRTLKDETARPPSRDKNTQQERFDSFRTFFNTERPHESLGQKTPDTFYRASDRVFPSKLPQVEYPGHFEIRRVSRNGGIRWNSNWVCVSHVLAEEYVGFEEIDDGIWEVHFGPFRLGRMDERELKIVDDQGRKYRKNVLPITPE